jgi:hypothetical protein
MTLVKPEGFDLELAKDLGALVMSAYKQFDSWRQLSHTQQGATYDAWKATGALLPGTVEPTLPASYTILADLWADSRGTEGPAPFGFVAKRQSGAATNLYISFRGTQTLDDWLSNVTFPQVPFGVPEWGQTEHGFTEILRKDFASAGPSKTLAGQIAEGLVLTGAAIGRILVTGHSLGGALASLAAAHIASTSEASSNKLVLYTFASPRVGDDTFATKLDAALAPQRSYRIANSEDIVTTVPLPATGIAAINTVALAKKFSPAGLGASLGDQLVEHLPAALIGHVHGLSAELGAIPDSLDLVYQHVGAPAVFTTQTRTIKGNHDMGVTYLGALGGVMSAAAGIS